MVANIQQIHTNGDGTLCISPMQVDKLGHHSSVNQNSITSNMNGNSIASCHNSVANSFSSVNSSGRSSILNCQAASANHMYASATNMPSMLPCDNQINPNGTNNLLELCHVLQNAQNNQIETLVNTSASNNVQSYGNVHGQSFTNINDRKSTKVRKVARQQQCTGDFNAIASYTASTSNQTMDRNVPVSSIAKLNEMNDTNNNVNDDGSSITIEPDLKPDQAAVLHLSGESSKSCKSSDSLNVIEFDENKLRTIKMERDTGTV